MVRPSSQSIARRPPYQRIFIFIFAKIFYHSTSGTKVKFPADDAPASRLYMMLAALNAHRPRFAAHASASALYPEYNVSQHRPRSQYYTLGHLSGNTRVAIRAACSMPPIFLLLIYGRGCAISAILLAKEDDIGRGARVRGKMRLRKRAFALSRRPAHAAAVVARNTYTRLLAVSQAFFTTYGDVLMASASQSFFDIHING